MNLEHLEAVATRRAVLVPSLGYARATEDLPEGAIVIVDGETGRVTIQ